MLAVYRQSDTCSPVYKLFYACSLPGVQTVLYFQSGVQTVLYLLPGEQTVLNMQAGVTNSRMLAASCTDSPIFAAPCTDNPMIPVYRQSYTCSPVNRQSYTFSLVYRQSYTFSLVYSLPRLTEMKLSGNMNTEITDSPIYDKVTCALVQNSILVSDWSLSMSWLFIG
jgi:hypothetical protein